MVSSGCRFLPRLNDNHCSLKDSYVVAWLVVSLDLSIFLSFTDVFCHNQFCLETLVNSGEYRETLTASPSLSLSLSLLLHPRPRSWTLTKASPCRWLTGGASWPSSPVSVALFWANWETNSTWSLSSRNRTGELRVMVFYPLYHGWKVDGGMLVTIKTY